MCFAVESGEVMANLVVFSLGGIGFVFSNQMEFSGKQLWVDFPAVRCKESPVNPLQFFQEFPSGDQTTATCLPGKDTFGEAINSKPYPALSVFF